MTEATETMRIPDGRIIEFCGDCFYDKDGIEEGSEIWCASGYFEGKEILISFEFPAAEMLAYNAQAEKIAASGDNGDVEFHWRGEIIYEIVITDNDSENDGEVIYNASFDPSKWSLDEKAIDLVGIVYGGGPIGVYYSHEDVYDLDEKRFGENSMISIDAEISYVDGSEEPARWKEEIWEPILPIISTSNTIFAWDLGMNSREERQGESEDERDKWESEWEEHYERQNEAVRDQKKELQQILLDLARAGAFHPSMFAVKIE